MVDWIEDAEEKEIAPPDGVEEGVISPPDGHPEFPVTAYSPLQVTPCVVATKKIVQPFRMVMSN
jgi:hypothetical protein